uniref:KRAB domain-containing protein n=1 Tax=Varanus komodoensis TaxID=61221 RepID=A0A8D2JAJ2_VARKO
WQGPAPLAMGLSGWASFQVAFEDVAVYFSPEEWAELTLWQRDLYWAVMKASHELVASLGESPREPPAPAPGPWGR